MNAESPIVERLQVAIDAAREAGRSTLTHFRSAELTPEHKADGTVVTAADREAEIVLRDRLGGSFPTDGILGEEDDEQHGTSGYRWIVDPIDGTVSFVHGVPLYGTLVGLEYDDRCVAGVIYMPGLDELVYAADGQGAWQQRGAEAPRPARVSDTAHLREAMLSTTSIDYFRDRNAEGVYEELIRHVRMTRGWGDCYAHLLLATGRVDLVVETVLSPWDIAAIIPIVREAGGRYSDWTGHETAHSPQGVSTNGLLHDEALALLGPFADQLASSLP